VDLTPLELAALTRKINVYDEIETNRRVAARDEEDDQRAHDSSYRIENEGSGDNAVIDDLFDRAN
jgi:hypothetical protein